MHFGITDLWTYVIGVIFIVLLPGPNSLFVLSISAQRGVRAGYVAAWGVFFGDAVLMLLTALGAASLLKAHPDLFLIVKYVGAGYLGWIGLRLMQQALRKLHGREAVVEVPVDVDVHQPFRHALLISMLNPKAILFYLSFFIQFVDPTYAHPGLTFFILGLIVQVFSMLYLSLLIFAGVRLAQAFRQRKVLAAGVGSGVGAMFIGFGAKLATASLN